MILFLKRVVAALFIATVSLAVPAGMFAFVLFYPTLTCHGAGAGGNCGEAYMVSIPLALLLLPLDGYVMVVLGGFLTSNFWPRAAPPPLPEG